MKIYNSRSRPAVFVGIASSYIGLAGAIMVFARGTGDISIDEVLYSNVAVPTVVNVMVLFCAPIMQNILAAYASALIVGVRCFWILAYAFQYKDSVAHVDMIVFIGCILCWVSGLLSFNVTKMIASAHKNMSIEPQELDALVNTQVCYCCDHHEYYYFC